MLLVLLALACFGQNARASTLFGKVIEINDGDVITVFNMNRPVRIRLMGIDAPEANQAFGAVAKQHLGDLVLQKMVIVQYFGIAHDGALLGKVSANGVDIGAQMIRDGVAWYDSSYKSVFSEAEIEVYTQSEKLARNERRGLWQDENPVSPWDFIKNEALRREHLPASPAVKPAQKTLPSTGLTSDSLLRKETANVPANSVWQKFQPPGENFSVLMPGDGRFLSDSIPIGDQVLDVKYYLGRDGEGIYTFMWTTGPFQGESDKAFIEGSLRGFLRGVGQGYESAGGKSFCEPRSNTDISANGYSGREFNLRDCTVPAMVRVYTKVIGKDRQMYVAAVFYAKDDPNVTRFLESFTLNKTNIARTRPPAKQDLGQH